MTCSRYLQTLGFVSLTLMSMLSGLASACEVEVQNETEYHLRLRFCAWPRQPASVCRIRPAHVNGQGEVGTVPYQLEPQGSAGAFGDATDRQVFSLESTSESCDELRLFVQFEDNGTVTCRQFTSNAQNTASWSTDQRTHTIDTGKIESGIMSCTFRP